GAGRWSPGRRACVRCGLSATYHRASWQPDLEAPHPWLVKSQPHESPARSSRADRLVEGSVLSETRPRTGAKYSPPLSHAVVDRQSLVPTIQTATDASAASSGRVRCPELIAS